MSPQGFEGAGAICPREDRLERTTALPEGWAASQAGGRARTESSQATAEVSEPFSVPCKILAGQAITDRAQALPLVALDAVWTDS